MKSSSSSVVRRMFVLAAIIIAAIFTLTAAPPPSASKSIAAKKGTPQTSARVASGRPLSPKAVASSPDYVVTTFTGVSIVPGTVDTGIHYDDGATFFALPFSVQFYDQTFSSVYLSPNGILQFSSNFHGCCGYCLPMPGNNIVAPGSADLYTADAASGQGIFTSVSGVAPHRIFNIEWRVKYCCSNGPPIDNFEVRLYEGQNRIDFIYGACAGGFSGIGVQRDTGSQVTQVSCGGGPPAPGTQYTFTVPACAPAPAGMISWWKGEGNAKDSQDDNDGTVHGDTTFPAGKVGSGFNFDGDGDYVEAPDSANLSVTGAITIDAWINPDTITNSAPGRGVVSKYGAEGASYLLFLTTSGDLEWAVYQYDGTYHARYVVAPSSSIPTGVFTHVAATFDPSTQDIKIYLNGVDQNLPLGGGSEIITTIYDTATPFRIGAFFESGDTQKGYFDGLIDEVEVFNRALTSTEVESIYIAGSLGKCPCTAQPDGMVSWWPGDGGADDIRDSNDGTLINGATFAAGEVRQGFSLNGTNQYVEIPSSANLNITGAITVDAWIKPDDFSNSPQIVSKYDNADVAGRSWAMGISTSGHIQWGVQTGAPGNYRYVDTPNPIPAGVFTHVAGTFDPTTQDVKIYVNGVDTLATLEGGSDTVPAIASNNTPVEIGWFFNSPSSSYFFKGIIDEVEIFNRALAGTEVAAIYNAGGAGKCRSCVPAPGGLISWWQGDGNTRDAQANNNGTFNGTSAFAPGEVDQAFSFNGNVANYVLIPPATALDLTQFTVDAWVYPKADSPDGYGGIVDKEGSNGINYSLFVSNNGVVEIDFNPGNHQFIDSAPGAAPRNKWTHIAGTYDGPSSKTLKLYIDGALVGTHTADAGMETPPVGQPTFIGLRHGGGSNFQAPFPGLIDEVQVFNRALTEAEVHKIYDGGHDGKCPCVTLPNLLSWWPADGDAHDIVSGNDGTPSGTVGFAAGELSQAFSFDGNSGFENIGTPANLTLTGTQVTLDGWVNPNDNHQCVYFGKANSGQNDYALFLLGDLTGCIKTSNGTEHFLHTGYVPPVGRWTHIAMTYDGADEIVYANGVEVGRLSFTGNIINEGVPFFIGGRNNDFPANSLYINGKIDEVEVFDRALSGQEVALIYHAGGAGKCANRIDVSASPGAGGTVSGGGKHATGSTATVVATPNSCYTFVNWTEGNTVVSTSPSYSFTVTSDRALVAHFSVIQYTISASASPGAGGSVSGAGTYDCGSDATLTATPDSCYNFVNWTEDGNEVSTSASYTFTVSANRTLVANFTLKQYTISVSASPGAGGSVSGGGPYSCGSNVTVTATPNSCYNFTNWTEGNTVVSTSASYSFTANSNRTLVANFTLKQYNISASVSPNGAGSVTGAGTYGCGSSVTLTANSSNPRCFGFTNWTENNVVVSTSATYTFSASADRTLVANFAVLRTGCGPTPTPTPTVTPTPTPTPTVTPTPTPTPTVTPTPTPTVTPTPTPTVTPTPTPTVTPTPTPIGRHTPTPAPIRVRPDFAPR